MGNPVDPNIITIRGGVTNDVELRTTRSGLSVTNVNFASSGGTRDADGRWTNGPSCYWHCTAWGAIAEQAAGTLRKGMKVIAVLRPKPHDYQCGQCGRSINGLVFTILAIQPEQRPGRRDGGAGRSGPVDAGPSTPPADPYAAYDPTDDPWS